LFPRYDQPQPYQGEWTDIMTGLFILGIAQKQKALLFD